MTALEMKYKFDIKMRELLGQLNHPFNTHEINRLLNEAQLIIVKKYADLFDVDEEVRKILAVLVKQFTTTTFTTTGAHTNGVIVILPSDVYNVVAELANGNIHVKPTSNDEYVVNVPNPFKTPSPTLFWRLDRLDGQEIISDGTTITSYSCDYIKMPVDIDVDNYIDCELPASTHEDIVNGAIDIALSIINRQLQTKNK